MAVREASHASSWYSGSGSKLTSELDGWLEAVTEEAQPGTRVIISPHAGFSYSGPCAAWAYKCLDLSKAKRIFILHPSHHHHLRTAALPTVSAYATPLSSEPLPLDLETIQTLSNTPILDSQGRPTKFSPMSKSTDEAEHSCEMQLPYIHRLLQLQHPNKPPSTDPPLIPIMIGNTSPSTEKSLGKLLVPYIASPENVFIISSDFCHWGTRFGYTYYLPSAPSPETSPSILPNGPRGSSTTARQPTNEDIHKIPTLAQGQDLRSSSKPPNNPKIYESIAHADRACMCAIASGEHDEFLRVLSETGNTVCGRHPIGTFLAGVEEWERQMSGEGSALGTEDMLKRRFRFMRYERSSDVVSVRDSSVSYVSAVATL